MRRPLAFALTIAALTAGAATAAAPPFRAVLTTPATAKANVRWPWNVRIANGAGKPIPGRVTVRIKDPVGGIHAVDFDKRPKVYITRIPFVGRFADVVTWPPDSRGFPLTFQVIVEAAGGKRLLQRVVAVR